MANINKELNQIKNAIYGKEVRGSIHDGIDKINKETEVATDKSEEAIDVTNSLIDGSFDSSLINANFEQRLDDEINNLQPDWTQFKDQTNSQLAETGEEIKQTKTDLTRKRDKTTPINLNDMDAETLAAIEGGEGTSFNLESVPRDHSVTPIKTTFAKKGKNLFNGTYVPDMIISGSTVNSAGSWEHREGSVSAVVQVEPGGIFAISKSSDTDRFGIGATVGYPKEGESVRYFSANHTASSTAISLQENEDHIIIYLSSVEEGLEPSWLQVEAGNVVTEYESPNFVKLELVKGSLDGASLKESTVKGSSMKDKTLSPEKTTYIDANPENLFGGEYFAWITSIGNPPNSRPPSDGLKKSAIVKIEGGQKYAINTIEVPSRFNISTYDQNPYGSTSDLIALSFESFTGSGKSSVVVETPENATHLLAHVAEFDDVPEYMTITKTNKPQKPYALNTKIVEVAGTNDQNSQPGRLHQKNIGYITDNINTNYAKIAVPDYELSDITSGDRLENTYALWDELVDIAPGYVTKTHMWDEAVEGLPVYKYTFEPPQPLGPDAVGLNTIKMLILGNIHGHETYATLTLINFFSDLVKKWQSDDTLQLLRWNIQFDVFPAYSPYGLKHNSRVNGNGVDLNSNLAYNWAIRDELGSMYYSGPYAMSEHENQQFDLYLDNLPYSYDFALDMHHNGVYAGKHVTYTRSSNTDVNRILFGVANQMNGFLHKEYSDIFEEVEHGVMLADHLGTGRMFQFFEYRKIPGTILEIMHPGGTLNSESAVKIAQTTVGNIFLGVIRNINDIKIIP